jgi:AcrR family transcriptional regulator
MVSYSRMAATAPRWRRRKDDRPAEIVAAALETFAETGFANAKLEAIARRAGVSKAALYLYFDTKEALFRAAVASAAQPLATALSRAAETPDAPFATIVPALLAQAAAALAGGRAAAMARMVIAESRNFPDLARIWHDDVVAPALGRLAELVSRAQARGEVVAGDPRLIAFSLMGPLIMGALFREVFGEISPEAPDLAALAAQHGQLTLRALSPPPNP